MVESSNIEEVKKIISFLKEQNENRETSSVELNNLDSRCPASLSVPQQYCDNFQHINKEAGLNRNEDIKSIINELKAKKEQINVTGKTTYNLLGNFIAIPNDQPDNSNFTSATTKNADENILDDSIEIIRKSCTTYSQKSNNKRRKLNHCSSSKQSHLNEFYSVVKSVHSHDKSPTENNKSLISDCTSITNKSNNRIEKIQSAKNSIILQHGSSSSETDHCYDFTKSYPSQSKVEHLQQSNADVQTKDRLKAFVFKNPNKRTVDDFCNNIISYGSNKVGVSKLTPLEEQHTSFCKGNIFLKSFSTGTIIPEKDIPKDINRDVNSLPITGYEMNNITKQIEGNTTFDDFIEDILKKIKNDRNNGNVTGGEENYLKENISNKLEKSSIKESNISMLSQQNDYNTKLHTSQNTEQNSDPIITDIAVDTYIKSLSTINFLEYNRDLDQNNWRDNLLQTNASETGYSWTSQKCAETETHSSITYTTPDACSANQKGEYIEDMYKFLSSSCDQNENLEHSFDKSMENTSTTYNRDMKTTKDSDGTVEPKGSFKLEDFLKNVIPSIQNKELKNNTTDKCKFHVKRYRKGKTKIYKLKKMKKKCLQTKELDADLNFHDVLLKMTIGNCEPQPRLSRFKSGSSISTSSSYIADDTRSEILSTGSKELTSPQQRLRAGFNELSKDESLRYSRKEWEDVPEHDKENIKMKIQDIFFQILEDFKNNRTSYFRHRRQSFGNCVFKDGRIQLKPVVQSSMTVISSGAKRSKAKFELMLYILKKVQTLLETDTKLTKRSLYYQLKALISDQRVSDRAINAISCLLDVGMWALNIIAQKGLVFGELKLLLSSGETLNCNIPGTLIPQDINDIVEIHSTAYFILVVEKEAIFHKLIEEDLPNKLTRPFIMITGKGFPDLNTQLFLKKLWMVMSIPVFILVDADPHGINIMLNYRFGSVNNAHVSQHLAVPNAKWLGVYPSEIINLNIARQPLNEREVKLVNDLLRTPYMEFSPKLVDELEFLLTKKLKAGIEGLIKTDSYLSEVYLPNKFFTHNFI